MEQDRKAARCAQWYSPLDRERTYWMEDQANETSPRRTGRRTSRVQHGLAGRRRRRGRDREQVESGRLIDDGGAADDPAGPTTKVDQRKQHHRVDDPARPA